MATTTAGEDLTEAQRRQQIALAAALAIALERSWASSVSPADVASTFAAWLERVLPVIERSRTKSAQLAATYASAFRQAELGGRRAHFEPMDTSPSVLEAIRTSLRVTGEIPAARATNLLRAAPDNPTLQRKVDQLVKRAGKTAAASAFRHVADGGRQTLVDITYGPARQDRDVLGYARTTRAKPCAFCAMLASRGPVYTVGSFDASDPRFEGLGREKVHDSCACGLEPVYSDTTTWPGKARDFERLWLESDGTIAGFRRLYEGRAA